MTITLSLKWCKTTYPDIKVEMDSTDAFELFQAQIFSLTNVPIDNQKILIKGKQIKTVEDMKSKLKDGVKVMLMGTASELPPEKTFKFLEDMSEKEKLQSAPDSALSAGLNNLGNTCYMNSTIQGLRSLPEFKNALIEQSKKPIPQNPSNETKLIFALGSLYSEMDQTESPVTPMLFHQLLMLSFPIFGQRNEMGMLKQQDADECLTELLKACSSFPNNIVEKIFGGQFAVKETCTESPDEKAREYVEPFMKLQCFISSETNYLFQGVLDGLTTNLERRSESLGRNAVYKREMKITQLPKYLIVQFVRFGWKTGGKTAGVRTKKVRRINFPEKLDIAQFCEKKLENNLKAAQLKLKQEENKKLGLGKYGKKKSSELASKKQKTSSEATTTPSTTTSTSSSDSKKDSDMPVSLDDDIELPDDLITSGMYELSSVITHQGRTGDSGHYIGWSRAKADKWFKFDDNTVTEQTTDDILKLSGGGDWHMSYINIYARVDDLKSKVWDV